MAQTKICNCCSKPITTRMARGLCSACYQRARAQGNLSAHPSTGDLTLFEKLAYYSQPNTETGCLEWNGAKSHGYGAVWNGGKLVGAHKASWELHHKKSVPDGLFVCHTCDNPACILPAHLFIGSAKENSQDMVKKGRNRRGEKSPSAKLTAMQVLAIRSDFRAHRTIAPEYGVTHRCIGEIKTRALWAHI